MSISAFNSHSTPISVSIPGLIALSRHSRSLSFSSNRVFAVQSGVYQSPLKGRGMIYDESRPYQPGDDIRNLDWRLTGRSGKAYTKLFCEERERPVFVWVDYRAPMFFATRGKYKSVIAAETAALLIWNSAQSGNRVGGIIFSERDHFEFKPRRGRSTALRLINQLARHPAWKKKYAAGRDTQSAEKALLRLRQVVRPGSLIFLLSDFRHVNAQKMFDLMGLSRHNEIVMVYIYDAIEKSLPPAGYYWIRDDQQVFDIDTHRGRYREAYHQRFVQHRAQLQHLARAATIHYIECTTQNEPHLVLKSENYSR